MIELLKKLVSINTIDSKNSDQVFQAILDYLKEKNVPFEHQILEFEGVKNLLIRHRGEGPLLALNGHYDVVPVSEGWSHDPFTPVIKDGKLYGRGASDMKAGVVANVEAFAQLAKEGKNVLLMVVGDEEKAGYKGTKPVLDAIEEKIDYAIVTEGMQGDQEFGESIKVGRRGVFWFEFTIIGKPGHASRPHQAKNPADAISSLLNVVQSMKLPDSPDMVPTTIVPTKISMDGGATNVIPREATITFDMRYNYAIEPESVPKALKEIVERLGYQASYKILENEPAFFNKDPNFLELVRRIMKSKGYLAKPDTKGGSSDARFISAKGIPVLEIGPRAYNIHSTDEYVVLEDVEKLVDLLVEIGKALKK